MATVTPRSLSVISGWSSASLITLMLGQETQHLILIGLGVCPLALLLSLLMG